MKERPAISRRVARRRIAGYAAGWLALLVWGALYRMPYDLRIRVVCWSMAAMGAAGLGLGLWKNVLAARLARSGTNRRRHFRAVLGFGLGGASLAGIPLAGLLMGCNGTFRSAEPFIVDGTVVAKQWSSGRSTSYLVTVHEEQPRRDLRFNIKREAFDRTRVGDHYHEEFQIGLFGWPCRY